MDFSIDLSKAVEDVTVYEICGKRYELRPLPFGKIKALASAVMAFRLPKDVAEKIASGTVEMSMAAILGDRTSAFVAHMLTSLFFLEPVDKGATWAYELPPTVEPITEKEVDCLTFKNMRMIYAQLQTDNDIGDLLEVVQQRVFPFLWNVFQKVVQENMQKKDALE